MMKPTAYYVMHCVDGSECLIAHCATLVEAALRVLEEHSRDPRADLSVWTSDGDWLLTSTADARDFLRRQQ